MSICGAIQHLVVKYEASSKKIVILGIVMSYTYITWVTLEWEDTWNGYLNKHNLVDFYIETPPAHHSKVDVVLKRTIYKLIVSEIFLVEEITDNFLFSPDK